MANNNTIIKKKLYENCGKKFSFSFFWIRWRFLLMVKKKLYHFFFTSADFSFSFFSIQNSEFFYGFLSRKFFDMIFTVIPSSFIIFLFQKIFSLFFFQCSFLSFIPRSANSSLSLCLFHDFPLYDSKFMRSREKKKGTKKKKARELCANLFLNF